MLMKIKTQNGKNEITDKLTEIFRNIFEDDKIELNESLSAKDVDNWDSLTHMLLISEIESSFSIKFSLKDLNKLDNVGNLIELIKLKNK